ncbi:hypothetical protein AXF42_Ash002631 [Apostasia shenzhenica]|uniref:Uncharacterized protein n=1 Tax=Apostasia shenzhenica TaxID=1088818 RepID=A0A2I0APC2_9ASPA|nr:hypothetical protein AXF42_Ash002631 [Apostasia shenzhenica]
MLDSVQLMDTAKEEFAVKILKNETNKITTAAQLIDLVAAHPQLCQQRIFFFWIYNNTLFDNF